MRQGSRGIINNKSYLILILSAVFIVLSFLRQHYLYQTNDTAVSHDISSFQQATVALIGSQSDDISQTIVSRASGVIISPDGLVLTAKHALESGAIYDIITYDRKHYSVSDIWYDPHYDLAVLQIRDTSGLRPRKLPFISVALQPAIYTGDVTTFGYGGETKLLFLTGMVVGYHDGIYEITSRLSPGWSGGPVFTHDGVFLGINQSVSTQNINQSFVLAVDKNIIQGFLDKKIGL